MIEITARSDGFRRAGMAHPATTKQYPTERFTDEQLDQLLAEPMLVVRVVEDGPEEALQMEIEGAWVNVSGDDVVMLADLTIKDQLVAAALHAMAQGNIIGTGKPSVEAMEATLGRSVSADERDESWAIAKAVKAEDDAKAEA